MDDQMVERPVKGFFDQQVRRAIRSLAGWYDVTLEQVAIAAEMKRTTFYDRMNGSPFRTEEVANIAWAFGLRFAEITDGIPSGDKLPVSPPVTLGVSPSNRWSSDSSVPTSVAA